MIVGIDEAGRGPVIGPMVLCGVVIAEQQEAELTRIGVADSKTFGSNKRAQKRRAELALQIREMVQAVEVIVASPEAIDACRTNGGMNRLEQTLATKIVEALAADVGQKQAVYPSVDQFQRIVADGARLFGPLGALFPQLEAVDGADKTHPVVAAASIIAKVERDTHMERLLEQHQDEFGPIRGGGYPNAATAQYLRRYVARYGVLPDGVRCSWSWPVLRELMCEMTTTDRARG